ncbi:MAG: DNA-binding protein [gamma proteobacterium symbiont of Ctena orbiculata]
MAVYKFTLTFALPSDRDNPEAFVDALFEAGCDDAIVGTGVKGGISLDFTREADSVEKAIASAVENVKTAIPGAKLSRSDDLGTVWSCLKYD